MLLLLLLPLLVLFLLLLLLLLPLLLRLMTGVAGKGRLKATVSAPLSPPFVFGRSTRLP